MTILFALHLSLIFLLSFRASYFGSYLVLISSNPAFASFPRFTLRYRFDISLEPVSRNILNNTETRFPVSFVVNCKFWSGQKIKKIIFVNDIDSASLRNHNKVFGD